MLLSFQSLATPPASGPTPCVHCPRRATSGSRDRPSCPLKYFYSSRLGPSSFRTASTAWPRIRHFCNFRAYGPPSKGDHPAGDQAAPPFIAPIKPQSACRKRFPGIAVHPLRFLPRAAAPGSATLRSGPSTTSTGPWGLKRPGPGVRRERGWLERKLPGGVRGSNPKACEDPGEEETPRIIWNPRGQSPTGTKNHRGPNLGRRPPAPGSKLLGPATLQEKRGQARFPGKRMWREREEQRFPGKRMWREREEQSPDEVRVGQNELAMLVILDCSHIGFEL
ncbi:hypothetical protein NDU88_007414 [Pleurodeles waltl]|uniref:Uncharacterized protein n=1 Tax=Pleurodeles waltl TaxID=8319 RepID=A0AAV7QRK5_PLEWA|nr:hypothetical protein NDU88_007414 [Pleurodeles waltl]